MPFNSSALKLFIRLLPALLFWILVSLYHLQFSLFLVKPLDTPWGEIILKNYFYIANYSLLAVFLYFIFWTLKQTSRRKLLVVWVSWLILLLLVNQFLLATPVENIHFPQYAFLAILILWAVRPDDNEAPVVIAGVLFWTTLAGIIDEILQYTWITASYSQYMDFNDFILNFLGAVAGVLIYVSIKPVKKQTTSWKNVVHSKEFGLFLLLLVLFFLFHQLEYIEISATHAVPAGGVDWSHDKAVLFFERAPNLLGSWQPSFVGGQFYVLSPLEGSLLLLLLAIVCIKLIEWSQEY